MKLTRLLPPAGLATVAALTLSPQALAQGNSGKPADPAAATVSLDARPNPLVFGSLTRLSGKLTGQTRAGVVIRFEQDATRPYGDSYEPSPLTATTGAAGHYTAMAKPLVNTQYRAIAQNSPPVRSAPRLVLVRPLVGLRLSDSTPRRGSLVRFSGSVYPAHDGQRVLIQKRSPSGRFVTVARPLLRDAGSTYSTYSRRLRVLRDAVYRVKIASHDDHVNGFSRTRSVTVH
ncbi:MAG TPA: hypothetical protein VGV67_07540 [Solirubrobacteraceae bacterium]|nr:hypothetical protein [Solirubrobacteraceae bacterium]